MNNKIIKAKEILKKYNQEHLLYFYNDLTNDEKEILLNDILDLDFDKILTLYTNSLKPNTPQYVISPLEHFEKEQLSNKLINKYIKIGEKELKKKTYAVVTMAGGQGSRLGYQGPKGTYEIKFNIGKKSLFELACDTLKKANNLYGITLFWYIMVSPENKKQTIDYFKQHNYFGYPKEYITFFIQDTIPLIDVNGKIVLQDYYKIKEVSNGNGNVFKAMKKYNIITDMKKKNIKWVFFAGIDNILTKHVDPLFLGMTIDFKMQVGSKSIFKKDPLSNTAVYCRKNGKPAILDYDEIDLNLSETKDKNGAFVYREANVLAHLMNIKAIEYVSTKSLPYHRAYKKNPIINEEGTKIVPTSPNTFKFENFIFDSFSFFDNILLLRVKEEEEFAPIKDFTGMYTPETAKEKYERYWKI